MTPQSPDKKHAELPPRLAVVKWPDTNGHYQAAIKRYPCGDNEVEFLSIQEHEELILQARASAKAEAFEEAAKVADSCIGTGLAGIKIREKAQALRSGDCMLAGDNRMPIGINPPEESIPKGVTEEEEAWNYLVKEHPWVAADPYYKENPEKSMTYRAAIWGMRRGAERERGKK